ncbi:serine hydrolase-like protein isoform X2 [Chaetodon auriga]|uniref:serine hydrolase-like protein isoform X2 n=1 Tax=Chaetodon auriga TaxID=39042 RepID=UPI0040328A32
MIHALKGVRYLHSSTVRRAELSVPVPWGEIRAQVWGPDHGRPVLCLHGWSDNSGTFNTLIPFLPKECRYVAVDLAGHGQSSHRAPGVFYSFPTYVMDIHRVVDALQWKKFSIIGHSMGGNIAGMVSDSVRTGCFILLLFEHNPCSVQTLAVLCGVKFILCFPQYSALYPEMVDAVVLLDSYGFLPTELKEVPKVMRQGFDELLQFEKKTAEKKTRVYTLQNAVERLMAANPTLSEKSVHILLERGAVQVEGGVVFSRDFRINLKNVVRISFEESLEMQSRIRASVLVVLAEDGFEKLFLDSEQKKFVSVLLQAYRDRNHSVVTVPGDHHIHLNNPEVVAPLVSDFLRTKVLSQSAAKTNEDTAKL